MSQEIWKKVPGYPLYEVSTHGRTRSLNGGRWGRREKPKMLAANQDSHGYPQIKLCNNMVVKQILVHRLVLLAFVGPCPPRQQCRHLDGNRANNELSNLCWGSASENQLDKRFHGTASPGGPSGEQHPCAKLTKHQVLEIRRLFAAGNYLQKELAPRFGVHRMTIGKIVRRERWAHLP